MCMSNDNSLSQEKALQPRFRGRWLTWTTDFVGCEPVTFPIVKRSQSPHLSIRSDLQNKTHDVIRTAVSGVFVSACCVCSSASVSDCDTSWFTRPIVILDQVSLVVFIGPHVLSETYSSSSASALSGKEQASILDQYTVSFAAVGFVYLIHRIACETVNGLPLFANHAR